MITSSVSTRGQLVIPHKLRKKYGLKPHTIVRWIDTGEGLMLIPMGTINRAPTNKNNNNININDPVTSSRGMLKGTKVSTHSLLEAKKEDKLLEEKGLKG